MLLSSIGLATVIACSACSPGNIEEAESSEDALTSEEASKELGDLIEHPEQNLRGVGDELFRIDGAKGAWAFYPYHPETTPSTSATVADDAEECFLVVGSNGEVALVDLATGAGAVAAPKGTTIAAVAEQLRADIAASRGSTTALKPMGLPGLNALVDGLASKLTSAVEAVVAKVADSTIVKSVVAATKDLTERALTYFNESPAVKAEVEAAPRTVVKEGEVLPPLKAAPDELPALPAPVIIEGTVNTGPVVVARALTRLAEGTERGVIELKAARVEPSAPLVIRRPTDLAVLQKHTSGRIATTVEEGVALVESRPTSVWTPGNNPTEVLPLWTGAKPGTEFVIHADVSAEVAKGLVAAGHKPIWVVPAKTVEALAEGNAKAPFGAADAVIESRSDGAARAIFSAAKRYVIPAWDDSLLRAPDDAFMNSAIFKGVDGLAARAVAKAELPAIEIVAKAGTEVTESLLAKTIARATKLLAGLGVPVVEPTVRQAFLGSIIPDPKAAPAPNDGPVAKPAETPDETDLTEEPTLPELTTPEGDETTAAPENAGPLRGKKTASDGCSMGAAGTSNGGVCVALALGLLITAHRRRRR